VLREGALRDAKGMAGDAAATAIAGSSRSSSAEYSRVRKPRPAERARYPN